jgi:DNA-binding transcriptional MerR regulator
MDEIDKAMTKVPDKSYFRIGEVAQVTGVKPYVLRYWETEFKAMIPPKSRSNQRMYRRKDIETVLRIKRLLYKERFTIEGARKRLSELQRGPRSAAAGPKQAAGPPSLSRLRSELEKIRSLLAAEV